jgi:hypothetical protein
VTCELACEPKCEVVTSAQMTFRVEELLADALVEFCGDASSENAEWIRHMAPLIMSYAIAIEVTDPDQGKCLEGASKASMLGLCHNPSTSWAAGMMAVTIAMAAVNFFGCIVPTD